MQRIMFTTLLLTLGLTGIAVAESNGEAVYKKACAMCHKGGIAGAPKTGDKAAWVPVIAQGKEVIYSNAINGKGSMPAKGGRKGLTEAEIKAAVDYMIEQSQ